MENLRKAFALQRLLKSKIGEPANVFTPSLLRAKRKRPQTLKFCFVGVSVILTSILLLSLVGCLHKGFTLKVDAVGDWKDCPRGSTTTLKSEDYTK